MLYVLIVIGVVMLANVGYALKTGTLHIRFRTIKRRQFPKSFWFCAGCFAIIGVYLLWLAYWDYRLL